jgi:hypothetical protein
MPQHHLRLVKSEPSAPLWFRTESTRSNPRRPNLCCLSGGRPEPWRELNAENRRVLAKLSYNSEAQNFTIEVWQNHFRLDTIKLTRRKTNHFTCWIEHGLSSIARIPWSRIERGESWQGELVLRDFYFQRRAEILWNAYLLSENARRLT